MGKPKKAATPTPTPPIGRRVLRTNTEIADWVFRRLEWPRRLARYEATARGVLSRTPDRQHPRHQRAVGILSLITAAKRAGARGEPIDSLMVAIEHQRASPFDPKRRPERERWNDRLTPLMVELARSQPTIQAKEMLEALSKRAAPDDPNAVVASREGIYLRWRRHPGTVPTRLSLKGLSTRLTWIKDHLAD